jgi:MFS family permease
MWNCLADKRYLMLAP